MTVFNPGGTTSVASGTHTLDGVGDVVMATPITNGGTGSVNGVRVHGIPSFIRIPLDATTVEVGGSLYIQRGTVS